MQQVEIGLSDLSCFISQHRGAFWLMCSTNPIPMIMYYLRSRYISGAGGYPLQAQIAVISAYPRFIGCTCNINLHLFTSLQDDTFRASIVRWLIRRPPGSCDFWFIYVNDRERFLWPLFSPFWSCCCYSAILFIFLSWFLTFSNGFKFGRCHVSKRNIRIEFCQIILWSILNIYFLTIYI